MEDKKEELLSIVESIVLSEFFTEEEKGEVFHLITEGNKDIDELIELLRKYLVAKVATGIKKISN